MSDLSRLPEPPADPGSSPPAGPASPNGQAAPPPAKEPQAPRRNRGWIWYFVILTLVAVGATATVAIYNWNQQLTPEQLEKARKLWQEKGPKDYELRYTTHTGVGTGEQETHYVVVVRGGKVRSVTVNNTIHLKKEQFHRYGMDGLFNNIEDFLEYDSKPGRPKVYKVAHFSREDGHLIRYVRSVMGSGERVEITVEPFTRQ
jgi:Family of unknown function (DUF6174)